MSWLSDILMGREATTEQLSTLSPEQQALAGELGPYLTGKVGQPATKYPGQITADIPGLFKEAYAGLSSSLGDYSKIVREALMKDVEGMPAWSFGFGALSKEFGESFATPMMETWRRTVAPIIKEGYSAIPGGLRSSAMGRGMEKAANRFYTESVQPKYWEAWSGELQRQFASTEAAAARRGPAAGALTSLPGVEADIYMSAGERMRQARQMGLTADYGEFLRTQPEQSPWLQQALQLLGTPSVENIVYPREPGAWELGIKGAAQGAGAAAGYAAMGGGGGSAQQTGVNMPASVRKQLG